MRVATGIALIIAASATMAQGQSLQEQATCAQQAKAAFQDYKEGAPPGFSDYQSHYNKELNKCLILINQKSELNGQPVMAIELHDAVERRWLASYAQLTKGEKEYLLNCRRRRRKQFANLNRNLMHSSQSIWSNRRLTSSRQCAQICYQFPTAISRSEKIIASEKRPQAQPF